jgi:hypothetical protein
LLAGIAVTSLALTGALYAHWTDTLDVNVGVQTGSVDAAWVRPVCSERYPWPELTFQGEVEGKDVGSFEVAIADEGMLLGLTVENAYPSYAVDCQVHVVNSGSVPFIIRGWRLVPFENLTECSFTSFSQSREMSCNELTVQFIDNIGIQVDPGDPFGVASSLIFHVEQLAPQDDQIGFWLEGCVSNWNEPQTQDDCFTVDDLNEN